MGRTSTGVADSLGGVIAVGVFFSELLAEAGQEVGGLSLCLAGGADKLLRRGTLVRQTVGLSEEPVVLVGSGKVAEL